jgi:hypothetical membrane protein
MKKLPLIALDSITCVPVAGFAIWAAWGNPFRAEVVFWLSIILSATLVVLPTALLLKKKEIKKPIGVVLRIVYVLMILAGGWILLFDSTYGPWWEIAILALSLVAIAKSIYVTIQIQKA